MSGFGRVQRTRDVLLCFFFRVFNARLSDSTVFQGEMVCVQTETCQTSAIVYVCESTHSSESIIQFIHYYLFKGLRSNIGRLWMRIDSSVVHALCVSRWMNFYFLVNFVYVFIDTGCG